VNILMRRICRADRDVDNANDVTLERPSGGPRFSVMSSTLLLFTLHLFKEKLCWNRSQLY